MSMWFIGNCQYCIWERDHGDTPEHWNHPYVDYMGDIRKSELYREIYNFLITEDWEKIFNS